MGIRKEDLPCLVIVVSGDVQEKARERMLSLGAIDFIRKPIDNAKLMHILTSYGIYSGASLATGGTSQQSSATPAAGNAIGNAIGNSEDAVTEEEKLDAYREMVNVAMGRAGENLAKLLGEFIDLPIPNVN